MIESSKVSQRIEDLEKEIEVLREKAKRLPIECRDSQEKEKERQKALFLQNKKNQIEKIKSICADKRKVVLELLDSFPNLGVQDYAGKYEIKYLEEHLKEVYPASLIEDYICLNPIIFEDEPDAYRVYSSVENDIVDIKQGNLSGILFHSLYDLLSLAAERTRVGMKVVFVILLLVSIGLIISPFLFLTVFTTLALFSAVQGIRVKRILRKLFSVKLFLNNTYDEDIFAEDRDDIMQMVDEFLEDAQEEYLDIVDRKEFVLDSGKIKAISDNYKLEEQRINSDIDLKNQTLVDAQEKLRSVILRIDEILEQEKKYAEIAYKKFLGTIDWKKEWLDNIFLETTPEHKVKMMKFSQSNTLYYSKDIDSLKQLSRLVVFQCMIQMHPDFACNYVLDYKYNGGDLTQFMNSPERIVKICYSEDDITKQVELVNNEVHARTNNILSSCESIEEFNTLMQSYGASGEYYVIVHIFGCKSLSTQFINNIRNGPRVGYFFKFYLTVDELREIADVFPLETMGDFYEVLDNPIGRPITSVRRLLQS